jgi:anti-sigma factor RsiW
MSDGTPSERGVVPQGTHLTEEAIEQLVDGLLGGDELQRAEVHLSTCAACAAEVDASRVFFAALAQLPRFAPSAEFADLVMAKVQVEPRASPVFAWIRHWAPETRRGWTLLVAALLAPMLPLIGFAAWVVSSPVLTAGAVLQWVAVQGRSVAVDTAGAVARWGMGTGISAWAESAYAAARSIPTDTLALTLIVLAVAIPLSAWSLVRLVRTPTGNVTYAN